MGPRERLTTRSKMPRRSRRTLLTRRTEKRRTLMPRKRWSTERPDTLRRLQRSQAPASPNLMLASPSPRQRALLRPQLPPLLVLLVADVDAQVADARLQSPSRFRSPPLNPTVAAPALQRSTITCSTWQPSH